MEALVIAMLLAQLPMKGAAHMSNVITVSVSSSDARKLFGGPIPAVVTVANASSQPVDILLPYPNPGYLRFESQTPGLATPKAVETPENERSIPIRIGQGKSYTSVYYLDRYFAFQKPGKVLIAYRLTIPVLTASAERWHETHFHGEFGFELVEGSQSELRARLAQYSSQLKAKDEHEKLAAAEALAFLDTPDSVEFVAPMLSTENLEVTGIRALARFPSRKAYELITGMLAHKDSAVVSAALEEIDRLKIPVERKQVQQLLTSTNDNTRWLALGWLSARPDPQDLPLVTRLTSDRNEQVRQRAKAYAGALSKLP